MRLAHLATLDLQVVKETMDHEDNLDPPAHLDLLVPQVCRVPLDLNLTSNPSSTKYNSHKAERKDRHQIHSLICKHRLDQLGQEDLLECVDHLDLKVLWVTKENLETQDHLDLLV